MLAPHFAEGHALPRSRICWRADIALPAAVKQSVARRALGHARSSSIRRCRRRMPRSAWHTSYREWAEAEQSISSRRHASGSSFPLALHWEAMYSRHGSSPRGVPAIARSSCSSDNAHLHAAAGALAHYARVMPRSHWWRAISCSIPPNPSNWVLFLTGPCRSWRVRRKRLPSMSERRSRGCRAAVHADFALGCAPPRQGGRTDACQRCADELGSGATRGYFSGFMKRRWPPPRGERRRACRAGTGA